MDRTRRAHPRVGGCALKQPKPARGVTEPLIRVGDDFEDEYPGASALATECFANVYRAADVAHGAPQPLHTGRIPALAGWA